MPQEDDGTGKLHHPEKVFWVIFPANDGTTKVMEPGEQDVPLSTGAGSGAEHARPASRLATRTNLWGRDELHAVSFVDALVPGDRCHKRGRRSFVPGVGQGIAGRG